MSIAQFSPPHKTTRKQQAYARALSALSEFRGCEVWLIGRPWSRTIDSLDRLAERARMAKAYLEHYGDRAAAEQLLAGWSLDDCLELTCKRQRGELVEAGPLS